MWFVIALLVIIWWTTPPLIKQFVGIAIFIFLVVLGYLSNQDAAVHAHSF